MLKQWNFTKLGQAATDEKAWMIDMAQLSSGPGSGTYVTAFRTASEKLKIVAWEIGKP